MMRPPGGPAAGPAHYMTGNAFSPEIRPFPDKLESPSVKALTQAVTLRALCRRNVGAICRGVRVFR